jgi:predicted molibdopterin-dependent oxidoreductase YjgC
MGVSTFEFRIDSEDLKVTEREDSILRYVDKHPNSMGAIKMDLMNAGLGGIEGAIEAARSGRIKAALLIYFKPLVRRPGDDDREARVAELVKSLDYSVLLAAHKAEWHQNATVVLPVNTWAEEDGTYTNQQGRLQLLRRAIVAGGEILPAWRVFALLLREAGVVQPGASPAEVFRRMAGSVPAFEGISLEQTKLPGVLANS